jgi:peptidoglycan/xylan/chitin deacetylase (PgdA/CDA1 family)
MTPDAAFPLGVCVLPEPPKNAARTVRHPDYVHEILGHAGVPYVTVPPDELAGRLPSLRVLVTVGEYAFDEATRAALAAWVTEQGGAWITVGGSGGMDALLGVETAPASYVLWGGARRTLGEGYLDPTPDAASDHSLLRGGLAPQPLHFFNGAFVRIPDGSDAVSLAFCRDAHGRPTDTPALVERRAGRGRCLLIAPDVTGTVVHIQQGRAITRDGTPAPDGTGPVTDGVLKSDDGQVLDWLLDRAPVPGVEGLSIFTCPVADRWRALLLLAILSSAQETGAFLPLLWFHPDNRAAVGHISHDTDGNVPAQAWLLLETMRRAGIRSTWCTILPGYEPEIIDAIRADGHELATHFDTVTEGHAFTETEFDRQWRLLCEQFGPNDAPVTNKNHYLRWEGDTEFFAWCVARGIRLEQSKGASKTGEAGFNFGTCHLYRPVAPDGGVMPIHELPTPTQDLLVFAPEEIIPPLLESVLTDYGVLHLLFHPAHIDKPGVADAIVRAVERGKDAGLVWKTGRELADYEEARRAARWDVDEAGRVRITATQALPGATVLIPDPDGETERWGFRFRALVRNLAAGESMTLEGISRT